MTVEAFAPAKINLTLHVTGRRADGYHLLDSLVAFANIGDSVEVAPADHWSLRVTGPEAAGIPSDDTNLAMKAARLTRGPPVSISLQKRLPIASGIGGGSADAAAALRALRKLDGRAIPQDLASLGADVPACLASQTCRMRGIGEIIETTAALPALDVLLVNPRVAMATPAVFAALNTTNNPAMAANLPAWQDQKAFCRWLDQQRNDLIAPAKQICPEIGNVLAAIRQTDALIAGMSGSGATCFGLYLPDGRSAKAAHAHIYAERPGWWAAHGALLPRD